MNFLLDEQLNVLRKLNKIASTVKDDLEYYPQSQIIIFSNRLVAGSKRKNGDITVVYG